MGVDTSVLYLMRGGKPMKKTIAAALALTMTLGMSTTALAAGNVDARRRFTGSH